MQITSIEQSVRDIKKDIEKRYAPLLKGSHTLHEKISEKCLQWGRDTNLFLERNFPFYESEQQLTQWRRHSEGKNISKEPFENAIDYFHKFCRSAQSPVDTRFWRLQLEGHSDRAASSELSNNVYSVGNRLLCDEWQKVIDKAKSDWEFEQIRERRQALKKELEEIFKVLQYLKPVIDDLGLDVGLLVDLSKGNLTAQDLEQFKKWAKYLSEDKGLNSLCELMGKLRQIELSEKIERVQVTQSIDVLQPDINSREEIVGIRTGRDLENVLASEKALLADVDTSILFDLKYVESRLMCFDMEGNQTTQQQIEVEQDQTVNEKEKQGPMIICVDTSGSMKGMPETIAKAISLFISTKARDEKRPCYLINFSTGIHTLDLSGEIGIASIISFLKMSFHGGTDVAPALNHALHVMQRDEYKQADLLIISDFIMAGLPQPVLEKVEAQRNNGNRFYSLVVGKAYMTQRQKTLFDQEWIYDPYRSAIHELISFQSKLGK